MLCPQTGYAETSSHLSSQEIDAAQTMSFDTQLVFNTTGSVLPCKIVCLWFCLCRCAGTARTAVYGTHTVKYIAQLYIYLCVYIMSPALLCKSSVQSGNAEQCALAFIHLFCHPVAPITLYHFIPIYVLIVNA